MNKSLLLLLSYLLLASSCTNPRKIATFQTSEFKISIDNKGLVNELLSVKTGKNHLALDTISPLLALRSKGKWLYAERANFTEGYLEIQFENDHTAVVAVVQKETHINFELLSLTQNDRVDLIQWGPYQTSIYKTIGETVGVVRDDGFAVGIQSLNIKTLGGYPWNESDRMPAFDIFKEGNLIDMHPNSDGSVLYRVEAAKPTKFGSSLQAYSRNRTAERVISDFKLEKIIAPPYEDGGVIGSKIALFGAPVSEALDYLGKIERAEGLPHPQIDGEWGKTSSKANAAYLITSFTEKTIDEALALTKKAGLNYLYHYGETFKSWGHFKLNKNEFPNGIQGLKNCVEKAEKQGIKLGTHCLSNFITTNDPYVTPIPDQRLAKAGRSLITEAIDAKAMEIPIASPDFFNATENNNLKTVQVGEELIRYSKVSESAPWKLLDCQRGAFNTRPSSHDKGDEISKLLDHAYKVFLTDARLTIELSERLAELYNNTGMRQISFDGLEGNRSTGLGTYGESLMPYTWYNNLKPSLKEHLIIDASRTTHFFWHIYSRMNWGEPWYAGFRESQTEYRFNNQAYFQRNFMPGMLGWFRMTATTSIEDIEWMLARAAGYNAGYALVADPESITQNKNSDRILELIGEWEKLRISNSFSDAQQEIMRDNSKEFSIEKTGGNTWDWWEVHSSIFTHTKKIRQPGEPLYSTFTFENPEKAEALHFVMTAVDSDISDLSFELNGYKEIQLPITLKKGQILKYTANNEATLYNSNWQQLKKIKMNPADFKLSSGVNTLSVDCRFEKASKEAALKLETRTQGEKTKVVLRD